MEVAEGGNLLNFNVGAILKDESPFKGLDSIFKVVKDLNWIVYIYSSLSLYKTRMGFWGFGAASVMTSA